MSNKADEAVTQTAQEKELDRPYPRLQMATVQADAFQMKKIVTAFKFHATHTQLVFFFFPLNELTNIPSYSTQINPEI